MVEMIIKVKIRDDQNMIGIKETIAIALEEIHDVTHVEVIDIKEGV